MSHDTSRKQFLAKVLGLVAVAGLAPKLLAKPAIQAASTPVTPPVESPRREARAVARRPGTV